MKKLLPHLLLVPILMLIPVVSSPDFDGTFSVFGVPPFQREFVRFFMVIIFFYLNLYLLLPRYYQNKKYIVFGIFILLFFVLLIFIPNYISSQVNSDGYRSPRGFPSGDFHPNNFPPSPYHKSPMFRGPHPILNNHFFIQTIFISLFQFLFSFLSSLLIYRNNEKKELERTKAKAELLNIKFQLQPHFLFNILNSIYSLTLTKSDDAPDGILKLSSVMRYVVQESSKDYVDLKKEIEYLKDYIALQLIRTDNSLDFNYTEVGDCKNLKIAPFILVTFIENAFKYGFNTERDSKISVKIIVQESTLNFVVFNKIVNHFSNDDYSMKIGLKNTLEHLEEIYQDKHILKINETGDTYEIDLKLNLI